MKKMLIRFFVVVLMLLTGISVYAYFVGYRVDENASLVSVGTSSDTTLLIRRGEYLTRAGNCFGCHTVKGGAAYAGGRILRSEYGNFVSPNITPDSVTGIGSWTFNDFWLALHFGKAKDGRLLYPAFPYPNYTQISRADAEAMFAFLKTIPAISQKNPDHELRFPYNQRRLLAFWRAIYFKPVVFAEDKTKSPEWNRGAYLVKGLGHCSACHSQRNVFGANDGVSDFSGGELAQIQWYAPSLLHANEAHLQNWTQNEAATLLKTGVNHKSVMSGPMAEVVFDSLQYLTDADINAMTTYLQAIPVTKADSVSALDQALTDPDRNEQTKKQMMQQGAALYRTHCMDCHGTQGEGFASVYPALKGNPGLQMNSIANPLRIILAGGFAPATQLNPRPYSMPPFGPVLSDSEVAILLSYIRNSWGNKAAFVTAAEVNHYRTVPMD
ncbi:cytochrome c [Undibacterium sp. 14-3-2]|uniref:cytochrome c n=1 Tax=Undibacterium sp. 14-3-2 TaxID=2800129 RepID=UPI001906517B|nr:cytochrome c [Undibacterium sp. 14-3-2]MBK1890450.1 cytochrome c [Undibacterium sp. 14-3-2]